MAQENESVVNPLQLTDGEIRFYQDEGYLIIPGLIKPNQLESLRKEVLDVMLACGATLERLKKSTNSSKDKLIQSPQYLADSALDNLVNSNFLRSIAEQLMGGAGSLYLPFSAVKSGGGGGTFHFHQDNQYTHFDGPGINLWCALMDMTPENGCLQVVPRTHLEGTRDSVQSSDGDNHKMVAKEPDRFLPVRMHAGDCIAFSRLTIHGSGPNHTDEPRIAYAVQYHRDDVNRLTDDGPKLLKDFPVYTDIGPKQQLTMPTEKSRDGH
jgi:2-oxoglutarate-dependent dioxygenase